MLQVWRKRILLPISDTRRETGRGLSNTNLESRHSWRMKLLEGKTEKNKRRKKKSNRCIDQSHNKVLSQYLSLKVSNISVSALLTEKKGQRHSFHFIMTCTCHLETDHMFASISHANAKKVHTSTRSNKWLTWKRATVKRYHFFVTLCIF